MVSCVLFWGHMMIRWKLYVLGSYRKLHAHWHIVGLFVFKAREGLLWSMSLFVWFTFAPVVSPSRIVLSLSRNRSKSLQFYFTPTCRCFHTGMPLIKPSAFVAAPLRSSEADACHSGIERPLLRKVIGREPHLWRFPRASAIFHGTGTGPLISVRVSSRRDVPYLSFSWQENPYLIKLPTLIYT